MSNLYIVKVNPYFGEFIYITEADTVADAIAKVKPDVERGATISSITPLNEIISRLGGHDFELLGGWQED